MKSIDKLKNPDIVEINGEKFQVIENTSLFFDTKTNELEMGVYLTKAGEKKLSPSYQLRYIKERPNDIRFFVLDNEKNWQEKGIRSVKL